MIDSKMLYFVYTYAGTLLAIATAIGGVLWGFMKWGGKTAVEQWLKRNYKEWELNTEKPYKEDFKRFEDKLDSLAAKDKTRFDLLHAGRTEAINTLFTQVKVVQQTFGTYVYSAVIQEMLPAPAWEVKTKRAGEVLKEELKSFKSMVEKSRVMFSDTITDALMDVAKLASSEERLRKNIEEDDDDESHDVINLMKAKVAIVETAFKEILGVNDNEKQKEPTVLG